MKIRLIIFICMFINLMTSCAKNEIISYIPELLDPIEIDVDVDGNIDYIINYKEADVAPLTSDGGTFGLFGQLKPYDQNKILSKSQEKDLFLREINLIKETVEDPLRWKGISSNTITSIITINSEGDWPNQWIINTDKEYLTYFVGLKLIQDNEVKIGWIELAIDTSDGSISIENKAIL